MAIESLWVEEGARSTAREIESLGSKSNRGSTMERERADKISWTCELGLNGTKMTN